MAAPPRPQVQRSAENERYIGHRTAAGTARLHVLVPLVRVAELDELLVEWRNEARATFTSDQPTADQILLIRAVCRARDLKLPVDAFATRLRVEAWLREQQHKQGGRDVKLSRRRPVS